MPDETISFKLRMDRPTPARMYDYFLGGKDNFAVDREAAAQVLSIAPDAREVARENRAFLARAVRFLAADAGIEQFIDVGTGLPTHRNVHEIAQSANPAARVVYVDNDPIVRSHANALLTHDENTTFIAADTRDPRAILEHPDLHRLIDLGRPVAVLFVAVLHFITDEEDPHGIVGAFRDAVPSGSYLALSHLTSPEHRSKAAETAEAAADVYRCKATSPLILRSDKRIEGFLDGHDLVDPGLVYVPDWRPAGPDPMRKVENIWMLGGVGRKR